LTRTVRLTSAAKNAGKKRIGSGVWLSRWLDQCLYHSALLNSCDANVDSPCVALKMPVTWSALRNIVSLLLMRPGFFSRAVAINQRSKNVMDGRPFDTGLLRSWPVGVLAGITNIKGVPFSSSTLLYFVMLSAFKASLNIGRRQACPTYQGIIPPPARFAKT